MAPGGDTPSDTCTLHATTVAHAGRAVLIRGASGSGKSGLALQMIALGGRLVADDRTTLQRRGEVVIARCPETIRGRIEARGIGILAATPAEATRLALVVDMDIEETNRLPDPDTIDILGVPLPLQKKVSLPHFPAALLSYLEHGRLA